MLGGVVELLEAARRAAARSVNAVMTAAYWEIGRRIVEFEQGGLARAAYGEVLMRRLAADLGKRFGRGFSLTNLKQCKKFYLLYSAPIGQTLSDLFVGQSSIDKSPRCFMSGNWSDGLR